MNTKKQNKKKERVHANWINYRYSNNSNISSNSNTKLLINSKKIKS